jgi:hypothetical protein
LPLVEPGVDTPILHFLPSSYPFIRLQMENVVVEESIPDPFEVGDDELEEEPPSVSVQQRVEPKVERNESPGITQEISIDSGPQSQVNLAQELPEKSNPPLPPKEVAPSPRLELVGNLQVLLSPNLFLPIPEVHFLLVAHGDLTKLHHCRPIL